MKYMTSKKCVLAITFGLTVFNLMLSFYNFFNQKHFGVIDLHALVSPIVAKKAKELINLYPNEKLPRDQLQALYVALQQEIKNFSTEKHLILFSKNTMLGGNLSDYTELLIERIKRED